MLLIVLSLEWDIKIALTGPTPLGISFSPSLKRWEDNTLAKRLLGVYVVFRWMVGSGHLTRRGYLITSMTDGNHLSCVCQGCGRCLIASSLVYGEPDGWGTGVERTSCRGLDVEGLALGVCVIVGPVVGRLAVGGTCCREACRMGPYNSVVTHGTGRLN